MSENLKPCPFCGGQALLLFHTHYSGRKSWIVRCENKCAVTCGHVDEKGKWHPTPKSKAIETWNRRAGNAV